MKAELGPAGQRYIQHNQRQHGQRNTVAPALTRKLREAQYYQDRNQHQSEFNPGGDNNPWCYSSGNFANSLQRQIEGIGSTVFRYVIAFSKIARLNILSHGICASISVHTLGPVCLLSTNNQSVSPGLTTILKIVASLQYCIASLTTIVELEP